jgi:hypothetical protein
VSTSKDLKMTHSTNSKKHLDPLQAGLLQTAQQGSSVVLVYQQVQAIC